MNDKRIINLDEMFAASERRASVINRLVENLVTRLVSRHELNGLKSFTGGSNITGSDIRVLPILHHEFTAAIRDQNPKGKRIQILNAEKSPEITLSLTHRQLVKQGTITNKLDVDIVIKDAAWNGGYNPKAVSSIARALRSALEDATDKEVDFTPLQKQIEDAHKPHFNYSINRKMTFDVSPDLPNIAERKKAESLSDRQRGNAAMVRVLETILS